MPTFLLFFLGPIGRYLLIAVAALAAASGFYLYAYHKGEANVQAKWNAAEQRQLQLGVDARANAEASIPDLGHVTVPANNGFSVRPVAPKCLQRDNYNRDCK